jgi:hypothetical protein
MDANCDYDGARTSLRSNLGDAMQRYLLIAVAVLATVLVFFVNDGRAGKNDGAFKPILPEQAYAELTKRSIATIEKTAISGAKDAAEKVEAEAAVLIGYTLSVNNVGADEVAKLRGAAMQAIQTARKGDVKKLGDFGKSIAAAPKAPAAIKDWKANLQDLQWMMENFRGKAKGGEGLHADLQYHPKLKNLNGTEAFIGAIGGKKLSEENLDKIAKELPNFAYRVAVMGSITHELAPAKDASKWREISTQMRDASIALADAAHKKNAAGVFKAAQTLESSCTQCHMVFKKN